MCRVIADCVGSDDQIDNWPHRNQYPRFTLPVATEMQISVTANREPVKSPESVPEAAAYPGLVL